MLTCKDAAAESPATGPQTSASSAPAVTGWPARDREPREDLPLPGTPDVDLPPVPFEPQGPEHPQEQLATHERSMHSRAFRRRKDSTALNGNSAESRPSQGGGRTRRRSQPVPDTTDRADLIGFTLTHALLRNELPRLAAAFAGPS